MTFKKWKSEALKYLHKIQERFGWGNCDWILGDDEDMKRDGFDEGDSPEQYVDYQIECGQ